MSGGGGAGRIAAGVVRERLIRRAFDLVAIPSFPGEEAAVAAAYAAMLAEAGCAVSLDERFPGSPSVVARLEGAVPGPVLQVAGHLDTVPVEQGPPVIRDGLLIGRGACDMKGGLAAAAEVLAALAALGGPASGSILLTAYGRHEGGPDGTIHAPLRDLLGRGVHGDLVYIPEGPHRTLPVAGKGSVIVEVHLRRDGEPEHELFAGPGAPNPVAGAHRFVQLVMDQVAARMEADPDVGPETFFVGAIRGGDLYNRVATHARIDGTRRYPAPRTYAEVRDELLAAGRQVARETGLVVEVLAHRSGQPFRIDPAVPFVRAFQDAAIAVTGAPLPHAGILLASDINHVVELTGLPTILHGVDVTRAHATPEWVPLDELVRAALVLARTVESVLGGP